MSLSGARAESAAVPALRDNTLIESATGAHSNGAGPVVFAGRTSQPGDSRRRALVAFDVAASVPAGVVVTGARLELQLAPRANRDPARLTLHRVLSAWGEGSSAAGGGGGAPATPGDATWIHTFYDHAFWVSAGGDFVAAPSASAWVEDDAVYHWGPTPALVADVQAWLDDPEANHGWILIGDESSASSAKAFFSRESADVETRPRLVVEYAAPCELSGARGAEFGLCHAYCEALDCDASAVSTACERLARGFARASAGRLPPCERSDTDADGIEDSLDNCPERLNADQGDADADGVGDVCDNCPDEPNADQRDAFGAIGVGDACDCPCYTSVDVAALLAELQSAGGYEDLACLEAPQLLAGVSATRRDGAACAAASQRCAALAGVSGGQAACRLDRPAPAPPLEIRGISGAQWDTCRSLVLEVATGVGLSCE